MVSRLDAVCMHADDPALVAGFWSAVLGWDIETSAGAYVDAVPTDPVAFRLRFRPSDERRAGLNKVHLHLTSATAADQEETVRKALHLGGRHLDVGQLPEEGHIVLADPEGNEFCVIEAGNSFLAGCGFLGEVACDGSASVGRFWSEALGWPLVWDEDEETAIQSAYGGTKIAWGGPPFMAAKDRGGLHFDLAPVAGDDVDAETERLVGLGATRVDPDDELWMVLADPDGNTFRLRASG